MKHLPALALASLFASVAGPAFAQSAECELTSVSRGAEVQHYVPEAMACVESPRAGYWYDEAIERDILNRVNAARSGAGLQPLALRSELRAPARLHSFDMAYEGFFSHHGPDGRSPFDRIAALDRTLVQSEARENLASVSGDMDYGAAGELLHRILMESETHRANILAPNITHMAIGLVRTPKGAWVTQLFVKQDGTLTAPLKIAHKVGDALALDAHLAGRDLAGAVFQGPRGREYTSFQDNNVPSGDLQLLVIGSRQIDALTRSTLKLNGPAISIIR